MNIYESLIEIVDGQVTCLFSNTLAIVMGKLYNVNMIIHCIFSPLPSTIPLHPSLSLSLPSLLPPPLHSQPKILFTNVPYTLATEEAERIGVDHIARSSVTGMAQNSAGK